MEESLSGINMIDLVQTGFHGAAIAVLLITLYLLRDFSRQVLAAEKGKQDIKVVESVRKLIIAFMVTAATLFFGGVAAQLASTAGSVQVIPSVTDLSKYDQLDPTLFQNGKYENVGDGRAFQVRDNGDIVISVKKLTGKLDDFENALRNLRTRHAQFDNPEAGA